MTQRSSGLITLVVSAVLLGGCTKREDAEGAGGSTRAALPEVDTKADQAAVRASWLARLVSNSKPLIELAGTSPGWRSFFIGDPGAALTAFEASLAEGKPAVRIGAARSALELAEAHLAIGEIVRQVTPVLLKAQASRPDAAKTAAARAFVQARLEGKDAGEVEGSTEAYAHRSALKRMIGEGKLKAARKRLERIDPKQDDIEVGEGKEMIGFRDPSAADAPAAVYAAIALESLAGVGDWAAVLRAEALLVLGRHAEAEGELAKLLAALPKTPPPLALTVMTGTLDAEDLRWKAVALQAVAKARAGDVAGAKALAKTVPADRIGRKVFAAWALSLCDEKVDAEAFPSDRGVLSRAVQASLQGLAKRDGAADVAELLLVERYVDALQRRFASALKRGGQPAVAVKMREGAEDKSASAAPSARNRLPSLLRTALDNVDIGRPRVSLKYLTRSSERLPAVAGAVEMLRDLLTLRSMQSGGGATTGQ